MRIQSILGISKTTIATGFLLLSLAACDTMNIPAGGAADLLKKVTPVADEKPPVDSPETFAKLVNWGNDQYNTVIEQRKQKNEIETSTKVTDQMDGIFIRLKSAALSDQEYGAVAKDMDWRLNTIRDKEIVMVRAYPGGGVAIYDGLFPVAETEGALAAILGHEMAHVLARHELKRIAGHTAVAGAAVGSGVALAMEPDKLDRQVMAGVTGAVGLADLAVGNRLWTQSQELDADCLGLKLAAKAGYDPEKIQRFWENMKTRTDKNPNNLPDFLKDHPINDKRLNHIKSDKCLGPASRIYSAQIEQLRARNETPPDSTKPLPGVAG